MKQRVQSKEINRVWLIVVLAVFAIICYGALNYFRKTPAKTSDANTVSYSTDKPSEIKPDKTAYKWRGGPTDPKMIIIPSIGVDGFMQNVGVDQNKQVAVPNNIHMGGWFNQSARPGENGLSIIDGHVDGYQNDGIFKRLSELKKGQTFTVEKGDGSRLEYSVLDIKTVPTEAAAAVLFSQEPTVTSQLNIITCGGSFDKEDRSYTERVIVIASLKAKA